MPNCHAFLNTAGFRDHVAQLGIERQLLLQLPELLVELWPKVGDGMRG
jgi:hypothetical protein